MSNEKPAIAIVLPIPGTPEHTAYALAKDIVGSALCDAIIEIAPMIPEDGADAATAGKRLASVSCSAGISSVMMVLVAAYEASGLSLADAQQRAIDYIQTFAEALRVVEPKTATTH